MQGSSGFPLFYEIVLASNSKLATEPPDKMLGLLSLANSDIYGSWTPDYALKPEEIYESVSDGDPGMCRKPCGFLGSWFGSGGLISQEASHLQIVQFSRMPLWVPNFAISMDRRRYINERNRLCEYGSYRAARDTKLKLSFGHDSSLQISGQPFATVRLVNDLPQHWRSAEDLTQKCLQSVKSITATLGCKDLKSILQAILADAFGSHSSTRKGDMDGEAFSVEAFFSDDSLKSSEAVSAITLAICGRSFLATEDGAMGLGPPHTRVGDEVWIFSGGNVPFIVRPLTGENDDLYQFVGDCYLQGVMYGEAFDSGRLSEENERQIVIK